MSERWNHVRVGDVSEQIRGVSYSKLEAASAPRPGFVPVLRANNITEHGLLLEDLVFVPAERVSEKQRVRRYDVVIAASSGSLDVVGKAAPAREDFPGGFGAFCKVLRPRPTVDPGFFAHYFRTPEYRRRVSALAAGVNINNLRNEHLDDLEFFAPPISEQRRITEILDRADAVRIKRRDAISRLDTLAHSIFSDMFGDPATNRRGWPERRIGDICEVKGGKRLPKGEDYSLAETPFRYIRVTDLKDGTVDESALVYLKPEIQARIARYVVNEGDVIISIAGSIGVIAAVPPSLDGANLTENAAKLVSRDREAYDAVFLAAVLRTPFVQNQIRSHIGQVTIGKLALFRIEQIQVPLPPAHLQREFVLRRAVVEKTRSTHSASLSELDALFASLQHRAFRGEL